MIWKIRKIDSRICLVRKLKKQPGRLVPMNRSLKHSLLRAPEMDLCHPMFFTSCRCVFQNSTRLVALLVMAWFAPKKTALEDSFGRLWHALTLCLTPWRPLCTEFGEACEQASAWGGCRTRLHWCVYVVVYFTGAAILKWLCSFFSTAIHVVDEIWISTSSQP